MYRRFYVRHQVHMLGDTSITLRPPFLSLQWNSDQKLWISKSHSTER